MLNLFMPNTVIEYSGSTDRQINYVRRSLLEEHKEIVGYYHNRAGKVQNSHILVRVIKMLRPDMNIPLWQYLLEIGTRSDIVEKQLHMVAYNSKGALLKSELFGENSYEAIISTQEHVEYKEDTPWKDMKPLRVLWSPTTDMTHPRIADKVTFAMPTLNIFSIDFKMLMFQYRAWYIERMAIDSNTDPSEFVYGYVLTNVICDMDDLAVFNAMSNIDDGLDHFNGYSEHPFNIHNYESMLGQVLEESYKNIKDSRSPYQQIIGNVPLLHDHALSSLMQRIPIMNTLQSMWATWLAVMPYISFLFSVGGENAIRRNRDDVSSLRIYISILENRNAMSGIEKMLKDTDYETRYSSIELYL